MATQANCCGVSSQTSDLSLCLQEFLKFSHSAFLDALGDQQVHEGAHVEEEEPERKELQEGPGGNEWRDRHSASNDWRKRRKRKREGKERRRNAWLYS